MNEDELADLATAPLKEMIFMGDAGPGQPNASRLYQPYARGYVFGYVYALIQQAEIVSESNGLNAVLAVHVELFGPVSGPLFVDQALADEADDSVLTQGKIAGARDVLRWLTDKRLPLLLTDYLRLGIADD